MHTCYEIELSYYKKTLSISSTRVSCNSNIYPKLHKRSAGSITHLRLNVFGRDIDLLLNPTDGILAGFDTPVHLAFTVPGLFRFLTMSVPELGSNSRRFLRKYTQIEIYS